MRRAILAGLLDAGVRGSTVASLWVRDQPWTPLKVLVASALPESGSPNGEPGRHRSLLFPLGATGIEVNAQELSGLLTPFTSWIPCRGSIEPLLEDQQEQTGRSESRWVSEPLDDVAGYLAHKAFAWLVLCQPSPDKAVEDELQRLSRDLYRLNQAGRQSESDAVEASRRQAWFRELSRAGTGGMWSVDVLVGSTAEPDALPLASILSSAAEHSVSMYKFRPASDTIFGSPEMALNDAGDRNGTTGPSFLATSDLVAALVRPPENELPGVRLVVPPIFDTTPERHGDGTDSVTLGVILDRFVRPAGPFSVSLTTLNRHSFVCGATGAGKSQTVRALLEGLSRREQPVPWLVIEPAKAEYARMAGRLKDIDGSDVLVIAPGASDAPPGSINPLEPASLEVGNPDRTFPLQSHADLIRALFLAAFQADEPFPQVLSKAMIASYERSGWDLVTGEAVHTWNPATGQPDLTQGDRAYPRYPSLADLQLMALSVVDGIGYDEEIKRRMRGYVDIRISSLRLGTPGRFFDGGHPLDFAHLLTRNVVLEAESITNDQEKAFVMGALVIRLYEQLLLEERERFKREGTPPGIRHVTVIEEAHRLLRNVADDSPVAHALELFASLLAEVRAYGEGIVVAEQIPSKLISDAIKNTALKIVHRLPAADDREAVGATMNLSDQQSQYIVTLEPGQAAVFTDGMDRPILSRMESGEARESSEEVERVPVFIDGRRRSPSCGESCQRSACTLLDMRHAQRFLAANPLLSLWAEVAIAGHEVGFRAVGLAESPAAQLLREAYTHDPRRLECALAYALEQAVGHRYSLLVEWYDPDQLIRHLALVGIAVINGLDPQQACDDDDGRWRAGRQRYADIEVWLEAHIKEHPVRSQEEIVRIAADRGLALPPTSSEEQLRLVRSQPCYRLDGESRTAILVGTLEEPGFLTASRALVGPTGSPEEQVRRAFGFFTWSHPRNEEILRTMISPAPAESAQADEKGAHSGS